MTALLTWWRARPTWQKWALAVPVLIGAVLLFVIRPKPKPSGVPTDTAAGAVTDVADAGAAAIAIIEATHAADKELDDAIDEKLDAAGVPGGLAASSSEFAADSAKRRRDP